MKTRNLFCTDVICNAWKKKHKQVFFNVYTDFDKAYYGYPWDSKLEAVIRDWPNDYRDQLLYRVKVTFKETA